MGGAGWTKRAASRAPQRLSTMGEVRLLLNITPRAIRFYEEIGLIEPSRTPTNARLFDDKARRRLAWIARLRAAGVSLKDIQEILDLDERSAGWEQQCRRAIEKVTCRAENLRTQIASIEAIAKQLSDELGEEYEA